MPRRQNSLPKPPVMTLSKAAPVLLLCVVFDSVRFFFNWFWLLGPALAVSACTSFEYGVVQALCAAGVATIGFYGSMVLTAFGAFMAMIVGLFGWIAVSLIVVNTNIRLLRENAKTVLLSMLGLGTSLIPFVSTLPALTGTTWHLYRAQIKSDKKKLREWQDAENARIQEERQMRVAQIRALRAEAPEEEEIPEYDYAEAA